MRRISRLEQEYRNLKRQAAPDLWSRIEERLEEHPERSVIRGEQRLEEEYPERGLNLKQRHRGEKGNRKAAGLYKGKGIFRPGLSLGPRRPRQPYFFLWPRVPGMMIPGLL